jgi:hypothetical protein
VLFPGEELLGSCVATQTSMFKGTMSALLIAPTRIVIVNLNRKFEPKSAPVSLTADQIVSAKAGPGGGDWWSAGSIVLDATSHRLDIKASDGRKFTLLMMTGKGRMFGELGGGETQLQGVQALGQWFADHDRDRPSAV